MIPQMSFASKSNYDRFINISIDSDNLNTLVYIPTRETNDGPPLTIEDIVPEKKFSDIVSNIAIIRDGTIEFATNTNDFWENAWGKKCPLLYFYINKFHLCTPKKTDILVDEIYRYSFSPGKGYPNDYEISTVKIYVTNISRMVATVSSINPWNKKKPGGKTFRKKRSRYHKQRKH